MKKQQGPGRRTSERPPAELNVRTRVWLTIGPRTRYCNGKVALLEAVDRLGSLRSAAQSIEMSYRHAWGMLRELDEAAGFPFLEHSTPGTRSALRLTEEGRRFIDT